MLSALSPTEEQATKAASYARPTVTALKAWRLAKIVHLGIEAEMFFRAPTDLLLMPEDLQHFIEGFLGRVTDGEVPRLSLTGFREEREKFPESWEVVMDQWDDYKDEIRGVQEEPDAWPAAQWTFDLGSLEDDEQMVDEE